MERKDLVRNAVQAAGEFNDRRLWMRFSLLHCFGVKIAEGQEGTADATRRVGEPESMLAVVPGAGGEEFGLSLFRGPQAASFVAQIQAGKGGGDHPAEADMLGFSMAKFGKLPPEAQDLLREAGLDSGEEEQVPHFWAQASGQPLRTASESELAVLLLVLRGIVKADKQRRLQAATLDSPQGISILTLGGTATEPQVSAARGKWQSAPMAKPPEPPVPLSCDAPAAPDKEETALPAVDDRQGPQAEDLRLTEPRRTEPEPTEMTPEVAAAVPEASRASSAPAPSPPQEEPLPEVQAQVQGSAPPVPQEERPPIPILDHLKIRRNAPCPCGSGRKFKKCCGSAQH